MDYEDWFSNMFNVDTSGNTDYGTGGDPGDYSGANYDAMFASTFGGDQTTPADYSAAESSGGGGGAGEGAATNGATDSFTAFLGKMGDVLSGGLESIYSGAKSLFTVPEGGTRTFMEGGKRVTEAVPGGGLNDLGKQLLAGALASIGTGAVSKWQQERREKELQNERTFRASEAQKDRDFRAEQQADKYRRMVYGKAPQLAAQRGLLSGG